MGDRGREAAREQAADERDQGGAEHRRVLLEGADRTAELQGFRVVYVDFLLATTPAEIARRIEEAYVAALKGKLGQMSDRLRRSSRGRVKVSPGGVGGELEYLGTSDSIRSTSRPWR